MYMSAQMVTKQNQHHTELLLVSKHSKQTMNSSVLQYPYKVMLFLKNQSVWKTTLVQLSICSQRFRHPDEASVFFTIYLPCMFRGFPRIFKMRAMESLFSKNTKSSLKKNRRSNLCGLKGIILGFKQNLCLKLWQVTVKFWITTYQLNYNLST